MEDGYSTEQLRIYAAKVPISEIRRCMEQAADRLEALTASRAQSVTGRPERVQAAFEVWRDHEETGPNASALFEYIEALEAAQLPARPVVKVERLIEVSEKICKLLESETGSVTIFEQVELREALSALEGESHE